LTNLILQLPRGKRISKRDYLGKHTEQLFAQTPRRNLQRIFGILWRYIRTKQSQEHLLKIDMC